MVGSDLKRRFVHQEEPGQALFDRTESFHLVDTDHEGPAEHRQPPLQATLAGKDYCEGSHVDQHKIAVAKNCLTGAMGLVVGRDRDHGPMKSLDHGEIQTQKVEEMSFE
jgi:hypothetical protein